VAGFIHDITELFDEHPSRCHLTKNVWRDATATFFGGVYNHGDAAHGVNISLRVGILRGRSPHGLEDKTIPHPPSQRFQVAR
ncbi:hypothetical protein EDC04DRAFT_2510144, partial [Pisolithus marmoratus]